MSYINSILKTTISIILLFSTNIIWAYTANPYTKKQEIENAKKYGPLRTQLALKIRPILNKEKVNWFLDTGTLLGAYRTGKMIEHDDDFDMSILGTEKDLKNLFVKLQKHFANTNYGVRFIDTYTKKIEVYDKSHGSYILDKKNNVNFHHVTVDIQLYTYNKNNNNIKLEYYRDNLTDYVKSKKEFILPLKTIVYEGHKFNAPNNVESHLKAHYGYIGNHATYNKETRKYEPIAS